MKTHVIVQSLKAINNSVSLFYGGWYQFAAFLSIQLTKA